MKTCPNCGEILGTHVDSCFKCRYDFNIGKVMTMEELKKIRSASIEDQKRIIEQVKLEEETKRKEYEKNIREREEQAEKEKLDFVQKLPLYEYATEIIMDNRSGGINQSSLNYTLEKYAKEGWRLHTALTNEAGKNTSSSGYGGVSVGTNATIDQTILIFERMISKGSL